MAAADMAAADMAAAYMAAAGTTTTSGADASATDTVAMAGDSDTAGPGARAVVQADAVVQAVQADVAQPADADARPRRRMVVPALLGLATIIAGGFGIWAAVASHSLRATAANANTALVDRAATRALDRDMTGAVDTIFSYNYADTARTKAAAQGLLTGAAIRQYNQLFALVEQQAPKERLVVTTRVTNIGVELLTGDRARVLVFANQQDTRAGTGQTTYGGAMFAVTAIRQHGTWKIENIDTFPSLG
jgi:Mce-associated membrane protein